MLNQDTITAISTAHGTGGIGIIRISGEKAFDIAGKIFSGKKPFSTMLSHSIHYGKIVRPESGEVIDEVLLSKMKKPQTFTREDVVEINCHGGMIVLKNILALVVREGARLAEPGEFTQRAFLNGRMDLSQAEAVIDLIKAKTLEGSKAALAQLEGFLSKELKSVRNELIELIAHIEVTVDYPEHDIEEITAERVYTGIQGVMERLKALIRNFDKGRILREGVNIVIIGRPNVGKSSLLNELAGKSKAIVTDIPGTTRDIIEEYVNLNGIPIRLLDTAGMRETQDVVEKMGIQRAEEALDTADLVLLLLDASQGMDGEDERLLEKLKERKHLLLLNKIDLVSENQMRALEERIEDRNVIRLSIKEGKGMETLENKISQLFYQGEIDLNQELLITNIRHKNLIDQALHSLEEGCRSYENQMPIDCITIDVKNAAEQIGEITGETVSEDVMREIFKKFCIGK